MATPRIASAQPVQRRSTRLNRLLLAGYFLLTIYGSLYPFTGWRDNQLPLFDFLQHGWPRWTTRFDLLVNVLAYLPLGFMLCALIQVRLKPVRTFLLAVMLGSLLSLGLEATQAFLPTRVSSISDWVTNSLGTLLGALLGLRYGRMLSTDATLHRWRTRRLVRGHSGDWALALLALWWLALLDPETPLFATGDFRSLLGIELALPFTAQRFFMLEMLVTLCGMLAAGLIGWQALREKSPWPIPCVLIVGLIIKFFSAALLMSGDTVSLWLSSSALAGMICGSVLLGMALFMPATAQQITAALALLLGVMLINLIPDNPYMADPISAWRAGHFLNFNGLTRLVSALWPFLALPYLMSLRAASRF